MVRHLKFYNGIVRILNIQWGSENWTCPVFKWSTRVQFLNGVQFSNGSLAYTLLYTKKKYKKRSRLIYHSKTGPVHHLNTGWLKHPVFKCFRYSNVRFLDPNCIRIYGIQIATLLLNYRTMTKLLPLIVAVLLQLYRIANSPKTFPGGKTLKNLPSRETSTLPSEKKDKKDKCS